MIFNELNDILWQLDVWIINFFIIIIIIIIIIIMKREIFKVMFTKMDYIHISTDSKA